MSPDAIIRCHYCGTFKSVKELPFKVWPKALKFCVRCCAECADSLMVFREFFQCPDCGHLFEDDEEQTNEFRDVVRCCQCHEEEVRRFDEENPHYSESLRVERDWD